MNKYDVIVVGAGAAGLGNSGVANTLGLKTLLVEKDPNNFGGDCTNYGCVPSKALIHIAHQFHSAKEAARFGDVHPGKADMEKVLAYIHEKQDIIKGEEDAEALRKHGQEVLIGTAKFLDPNTIDINGEKFTAKIILLCTGSSPRMISIPGMDQIRMFTNESLFFECDKLPDHFVVIGGGPIGCEMAQAFQRLGSQVYIIDRGNRLLGKEPEKVSQILKEQFEKEGIKVFNQAVVKSFESGKALIESKLDGNFTLPCDTALMAIGRVVNTKDMGLKEAGIELTERGKIKTDAYLRTTNPNVYAIGDAAGSYMFSHGAEKMVRQLWRNLLIPLFKRRNTMDDLSWVTFTDPQIAHFGLTEDQMHEQGVGYYRQDQDIAHDDRGIIQEYEYGHTSLWMTPGRNIGNRTLLAGSMIAPQAGELFQEMELAKHAGIPIKKISNRVYPYPVAARINQKTIRGVMNATITDFKKKVARMVFRFLY